MYLFRGWHDTPYTSDIDPATLIRVFETAPTANERYGFLRSLRFIDDRCIIPALLHFLSIGDSTVRSLTIQLLWNLDEAFARDHLLDVLVASRNAIGNDQLTARTLLQPFTPRDDIVRQMQNRYKLATSIDEKKFCLSVIGRSGNREALGFVLALIQHEAYDMRIEAALAALRLDSATSVSYVLPLLHDSHPMVRTCVAEALGPTGQTLAVQPLIATLRGDPDPMVRREAARSLGELGDRAAWDALMDTAEHDDEGDEQGYSPDVVAARALEHLAKLHNILLDSEDVREDEDDGPPWLPQ